MKITMSSAEENFKYYFNVNKMKKIVKNLDVPPLSFLTSNILQTLRTERTERIYINPSDTTTYFHLLFYLA